MSEWNPRINSGVQCHCTHLSRPCQRLQEPLAYNHPHDRIAMAHHVRHGGESQTGFGSMAAPQAGRIWALEGTRLAASARPPGSPGPGSRIASRRPRRGPRSCSPRALGRRRSRSCEPGHAASRPYEVFPVPAALHAHARRLTARNHLRDLRATLRTERASRNG